MPKTKIIATIGPSCQDAKTLREMILNGLSVARFNFSHTSWPKAQEVIDTIKKLRDELNMPVAIMIDLQGPKIRLGKVEETILLKKGSYFTLKNKDMMGNEEMASISNLSYYEINEHRPSYETLFKLADVYDVTIDYLLGHNSPLTEKDMHFYNQILECNGNGLRVARRPYDK